MSGGSTSFWTDLGKAFASESAETLVGRGVKPWVKEWASRELAQVTLRNGNPYKLANTALRDLFSRQSLRWLRRHPNKTITSLGAILLRNDEIADPVLRKATAVAERRGMLVGLNRVADQPFLYRLAKGKVGNFLLESSAPDFLVGFGFRLWEDIRDPTITDPLLMTERAAFSGLSNALTGAAAYATVQGGASAFVAIGWLATSPPGWAIAGGVFVVGIAYDLLWGGRIEKWFYEQFNLGKP